MQYKKLHLAGCVILNENGELLLLHRNTSIRKQWETPGGKIENGEDAQKAAEREIEEELGVDIEIIKKLGKKDFIEDEHVMTYTWYQARVLSGKPKIMETEKFDDLKYFSWKKLQEIKDQLSPNTHNLVEAYFSNNIQLS
jgi:8-oxo-dGTP diphosphatase